VLENMDARKPVGQRPEELGELFAALPEAGFCFDVAHAAQVDESMALAHALLDAFGGRLRHVHVSSLRAGRATHVPLYRKDEHRFREVLQRCPDVPWILEALPPRR
jgi:sugar phosphate isomerase/epimerase